MNSREAESLLKQKGKSFYWANCFLSQKHSSNAAMLYAICRQVDDLVDEADSSACASEELARFRKETLSSHFFREARINADAFLELIRGVESDLNQVRIENESDLIQYCYRVAGTVGIMMCNVFKVDDDEALARAVDLGIAMQLTNICRDVAIDAKLDRRYLPGTLVEALSPKDLEQPSAANERTIREALCTLLLLADKYYESGQRGLVYLPVRARFAILVASKVYREIGLELRNRNYDYWTERVSVHSVRKIILTFQSLFELLTSTQYWKRPPTSKSIPLWK